MTTARAALPPADYPYPDWAPEGDTFHVPEPLREYYAAATPSPAQEAAYHRSGIQIAARLSQERAIARARAAGRRRDDFDSMIAFLMVDGDEYVKVHGPAGGTESEMTFTVEVTRVLEGRNGFAEWLHLTRLDIAARRRDTAIFQQRLRLDSTCEICGQTGADRSHSLTGVRHARRVCPQCSEIAQRRVLDTRTVRGIPRRLIVEEWLATAGWILHPIDTETTEGVRP